MSDAASGGPADDASMVTPAMQAAIGQEAGQFTIEIDADLVRRLAEALEVDDAELRAALRCGEVGTEVPPWAVLTHYGRLRPNPVPDAPLRGLQAADEFTILGPIRIGDRLTVVQRLADVQERIGGRVGHSLFVHHEWSYTNQHGEVVARTRRTRAHFAGKHSGE
ncbi:MAG: MaoC family dehydratase N-terminal domain-containing protein [Chloroflexi bacterium]|nr:MaoC family dehydratase N-terminal domain-containing protein [Chloroflexota bacterium]